MKRQDYITWPEFFMGVAFFAACRSKDPNTQVGACIASPDNFIISTGYNGMPRNCSDDVLPWDREGDFQNTKYAYVVHAELNAIFNSRGQSLQDSTLYVTEFPCNDCAKGIIQAGIKKVVYLDNKHPDSEAGKVAKILFQMAKIEVERMRGKE